MTDDLQFRDALSGDFEAIRDLSCQLAQHIEAPEPALTAERFSARYVEPGAPMRLRLAERDGKPVGLVAWITTCELYSGEARVYISDLVVAAAARGMGVGAALMAEVAAWARAHGVTRMGWEVWHRNTTAMRFYEALGAERDDEALPYMMTLAESEVET